MLIETIIHPFFREVSNILVFVSHFVDVGGFLSVVKLWSKTKSFLHKEEFKEVGFLCLIKKKQSVQNLIIIYDLYCGDLARSHASLATLLHKFFSAFNLQPVRSLVNTMHGLKVIISTDKVV